MISITDTINTHAYTVDQWLLDELEKHWSYGSYSKRENVDALALELTLKHQGKITTLPKVESEKYQWRHDWAYTPEILIDLKRKPNKYRNISLPPPGKYGNGCKMIESYNMGQLTHIVGFSQNIETDYKIGDVLKFKFLGILPLKEAIHFSTNKIVCRLLSPDHLQNEEDIV